MELGGCGAQGERQIGEVCGCWDPNACDFADPHEKLWPPGRS